MFLMLLSCRRAAVQGVNPALLARTVFDFVPFDEQKKQNKLVRVIQWTY